MDLLSSEGESYLRMYFTQPCKSQQAVTYSGTHRKLCSNQKSPSWQLGSEGRFLFSSHDTWRRPCLSASLGILVLRTQWPALVLTPACRLPSAQGNWFWKSKGPTALSPTVHLAIAPLLPLFRSHFLRYVLWSLLRDSLYNPFSFSFLSSFLILL